MGAKQQQHLNANQTKTKFTHPCYYYVQHDKVDAAGLLLGAFLRSLALALCLAHHFESAYIPWQCESRMCKEVAAPLLSHLQIELASTGAPRSTPS